MHGALTTSVARSAGLALLLFLSSMWGCDCSDSTLPAAPDAGVAHDAEQAHDATPARDVAPDARAVDDLGRDQGGDGGDGGREEIPSLWPGLTKRCAPDRVEAEVVWSHTHGVPLHGATTGFNRTLLGPQPVRSQPQKLAYCIDSSRVSVQEHRNLGGVRSHERSIEIKVLCRVGEEAPVRLDARRTGRNIGVRGFERRSLRGRG